MITNVQTGDNLLVGLVVGVLILSVAALITLIILKKKNNNNKE